MSLHPCPLAKIVWILAIGGSLPVFTHAQATFGSVTGTVSDMTGAVLPGVSITISNLATNVHRNTISNESGRYEATHLPPGSYSISAELPGFKRFLHERVDVGALSVVRIDIRMEIGEMATEITVESGTPVVDSQTPTISQSRSFQQLRELPVNLRGSGIVYDWSVLTPTGTQGAGSRRSFGGARSSSSYFNVDGLSSNSTGFGNQISDLSPSAEAIQEVSFSYVNSKAEFGEVGNVTAITKSGGNSFHGSLFWYNIHSALSARDFFATTRGPIDPQTGEELFTQNNQLGGSIGGPIKQNKVFFFIHYEYQRDTSPTVISPSVPTAKMREGDFSELLNLRNPIVVRNPFTGEPFLENKIPSSLLYPGSGSWQNRFYPLPNFGPSESFSANFRETASEKEQAHQSTNRLDLYLSEKHHLYGRFGYQRILFNRLPGELPAVLTDLEDTSRTGTQILIADTWTVSPGLINEFKVGYSRRFQNRSGRLPTQELVDLLGIEGLPGDQGIFVPPDVRITGFARVQMARASFVEEGFQVLDHVTWVKGRHTFKMGIDWRPQRFTQRNRSFPDFGRYDFRGGFSGFSWADFLLGLPAVTTRTAQRGTLYARFHSVAGFFQDDFQLKPNFTLNYGLRFDYDSPLVDKFDILSSFDPALGALVVPTSEALSKVPPQFPEAIPILTAERAGFPSRSLRDRDTNNFAPRLGFAYRPFGSAPTVIRGGYGIFYDLFTANLATRFVVSDGPFDLNEQFQNSIQAGSPLLTLEQPFLARGTLGSINVRGTTPDIVNPYVQQWNLSLEQDIGFETLLRLSYLGAKTTHLVYGRNINQPPPSSERFSQQRRPWPLFNEVILGENGGNQTYSAFLLHVERKMPSLYFQTSWTWAKNLTDVDDNANIEGGTFLENAFDRARERGNTQFTPRHRLIANVIWDLPLGSGKRFLNRPGLASHMMGGWKLTATLLAQTGHFLTPRYSRGDPANVGINCGSFTCRPDRLSDGNLPKRDRSIEGWFDTAAFVPPPNGRFGNAGTGIIEGPGRAVLHLGLFKRFALTESTGLRVQVTATNVLNHPAFGDPAVNISAPGSVGTISSLIDRRDRDFALPREVMIGVRYDF